MPRTSRCPLQRNIMTEQLGRRYALVMLASMTLAATMGMVAWGPMLVDAEDHRYADERMWLGIPAAANVLVNLPMLLLGAWGWRTTQTSAWPEVLSVPWRLFQWCAMLSAVFASVYHASPGDTLFVLTHVCTACGFISLTLGALAERVHPRFGSRMACRLALAGAALLGAAMLIAQSFTGHLDMRPLLLLEIIPVLVIPAGAFSLPGTWTRAFDWIVVLMLYTFAKLLELGDSAVLNATGWVSGHTMMHLALAAAVGWMAYGAAESRRISAAPAGPRGAGESQRETSLNTAS